MPSECDIGSGLVALECHEDPGVAEIMCVWGGVSCFVFTDSENCSAIALKQGGGIKKEVRLCGNRLRKERKEVSAGRLEDFALSQPARPNPQ